MSKILDTVSAYAVDIALKLLFAALILVIGKYLVKLIVKLFTKSKLYKEMNEAAAGFIKSALSFVLNIVLILTAAAVLGVPMSSIIALLGSAGLAIGLALQGGLSNFAGGIILLIFKPFDLGDYIVCGGEEGSVKKISIFYTTLVTPDSRRIVLPNSNVTSSAIVNVTAEGIRRLDVDISVTPTSDIDKALALLTETASLDKRITDAPLNDARLAEKPAPFAAVVGYGAGCLNLSLRVWCKAEDYWSIKFDLTKSIPEVFSKNGIAVARPVLDVTTVQK